AVDAPPDRARPREAVSPPGCNQGSVSVRARSILIVGCLSMLFPAARAANVAIDTLDTRPAVLALDELRRAWFGQLNEMITTARALAVADDTYEFVKRPNIP